MNIEGMYRQYYPHILNLCKGYIKKESVVEDVVQCIFIKAFKNKQAFIKQAKPFTWLYRIAVNECLNYIKKYRCIYEEFDESKWFHNSSNQWSGIEKKILYTHIIKGFDKTECMIILLYAIECIPMTDIATILGISKQAAHKKTFWI